MRTSRRSIPSIRSTTRRWMASTRRALSPVSARALRTVSTSLLLAVTLLVGSNSPLVYGMGMGHAAMQAPRPQGTPHHFDPKSGTTSILHRPPASTLPPFTPQTKRPLMSHGFVPSMKPGLLTLDPLKATQFVGSDGRLEIDVPAGAVTSDDVAAAAGGTLALRITEIAPPSGSNAGSTVVSLGSYAVEVVDGLGNRVAPFADGLRAGLTLKLHYSGRDSAFALDRAFVVFNGAHRAR